MDWLNSKLRVERGIVAQEVDDVKSEESRKQLTIDSELLTTLRVWKQATQFSASEDWVFASSVQLGRLPWSYDQIWRVYQKAAKGAGIEGLGTHSLRPHVPCLAGFCWHASRSSTKADAPHRCPHNNAIWGCVHIRYGRGTRQSCMPCAERHGNGM